MTESTHYTSDSLRQVGIPTPVAAQNSTEQFVEETEHKPYTLRALKGSDVFPMSRIISTIGIDHFKEAFNQDDIKTMVKSLNKQEGVDDSDDSPVSDDVTTAVGMSVVLSVAQIILAHLSDCEADIYSFLSSLSGMKPENVADLPFETFMEMIIDIIQKPEFKNFIKVASKLLK